MNTRVLLKHSVSLMMCVILCAILCVPLRVGAAPSPVEPLATPPLTGGPMPLTATPAAPIRTLTAANLTQECKKRNDAKRDSTCAAKSGPAWSACVMSFNTYTHTEALVPYEFNPTGAAGKYECRTVKAADSACVKRCLVKGYAMIPVQALNNGKAEGALAPIMCNQAQRLSCRESVSERTVLSGFGTSASTSTSSSSSSLLSNMGAGFANGVATGVGVGVGMYAVQSMLGNQTAGNNGGGGGGVYPYSDSGIYATYISPPQCVDFATSIGATPLPKQSAFSLSWTHTGGAVESSRITPGVGVNLESPVTIMAPAVSTTYTLTLTNSAGSTSCRARVHIGPDGSATNEVVSPLDEEIGRVAAEQDAVRLVNPLQTRVRNERPGYSDADGYVDEVEGEDEGAATSAASGTRMVQATVVSPQGVVVDRDGVTVSSGEGSFVEERYTEDTQGRLGVYGGGDLAGYEAALRAERARMPSGVEEVRANVWGTPSSAVTGTLFADQQDESLRPRVSKDTAQREGFFSWMWSLLRSLLGSEK